METNLHFGKRVKRVFDRAGHTVEEASRRVNISTSNLYKKLSMSDLDTEFLRKVSAAYGVSLASFFADNQYSNNHQTGQINAVGEKIIQSYGQQNSSTETAKQHNELNVLQERVKGLEAEVEGYKKQIELYQKVVKMYESATKPATN